MILVYVLCHSKTEFITDLFCLKHNIPGKCICKKHLLKQSKYFENEFYFWWIDNNQIELEQLPNIKYIGLIVAHYVKKTGNKIDFVSIAEQMGKQDFYGILNNNNDSLNTHPLGLSLMNQSVKLLGLSADSFESMRVTHCNYWLMTVDALNKYSREIKKLCELWETSNICTLLNSDSTYSLKKLTKRELLEKTGFPYYTYHPFILERMHKIVLVSLGFRCDEHVEYNPISKVIRAILYNKFHRIKLTDIIQNYMRDKKTFKIDFKCDDLYPYKLYIKYEILNIVYRIKLNQNDIMIPIYK